VALGHGQSSIWRPEQGLPEIYSTMKMSTQHSWAGYQSTNNASVSTHI